MLSGRKFLLQRGRVGGAAVLGLAVCGGLALAPSAAAPAQAAPAPDSAGTDFWLGFPTNYSGGPELTLFITGGTATTGTVAIEGLSFSEPFSVTPGTVTSVSIPVEAEMATTADPENKGIHVTAGSEVTVYGLNRIQYTTDAYLGLPTDILGSEYIVLGSPPASGQSEGAVVATANATTVTINPSADLDGGQAAGTPFTVHMDQGQTYQFTSYAGDVSGTVVTADKAIAVYGGNTCANIPDFNYYACDHIVEQMPPMTAWGKAFLTVPLATRLNGDTIRMVAAQDATAVRINGSLAATLNRGQVWQQIVDGQSQITADKPILVAQYSNGTTYDEVTSDPFEMLIPPTEQFLPSYTVSTPATGFSGNYINVVAPTSSIGSVKLDGTVVPAASFTPIGTTGFSGAQLTVELGSHTVTGSLPIGVFSYGFDSFDSYGYPGGMSLAPVATVSSLTLAPPTETLSVGQNGCVTATVKNSLGEPVSGVRVDFTRDGANPGQGFSFTDDAGHAQYCYDGANGGDDAIVATLGALNANAAKTWTGGGTLGPDEVDTDEDVPVEIFVLTNDPPPPGVGLWEVTAVTQPANGSVEINDEVDPEVEDTVVFTPARDFFGSTSFTYTTNDGDGHTATHTVLVTVGPINDEPVVSTGADVSTAEGNAVQVNGTATDVDGPFPLSYQWVVLDGPEVTVERNGTFADENSPTTLFTPMQDGEYLLQLEACDPHPDDPRCDTDPADDTVTVTVGNVAPTVSLPANRTVNAGTSSSLAVSFTDPGSDDAHTATVDWGDGSPVTTVDPAASPFTVSHTFTTTGVRTVQVCVSDGVDETCESMTITVVDPVTLSIGDVAIDEPDSGTAPMTFTITASPTPTATVTVVAKTVNGSATAPSDYTALPAAGQTVTFAAGQATRTVTVPIVGDLLREPNESFTVTLSTPVGATIGDGSALGRIRNHTDECTVLGTTGNDTLNGNAGNDVICGLGGDDTINGNAGNDTILAGDGGDTIRGGAGNDIIRGQAGNDVITGEAGNDVIDGGAGSDEASWAGAPGGVTVDLTANTATGWGTDTLANMERARGSNFNDTIRGNGLANMLWGAGGNDTLTGRSANDHLEGQAGDDTVRGEAGSDTALGGDGNDRVDGGAGVDLVKGDAGNDLVAGGAGNDNSPDGTTAGVHGGTGTNNLNGGLGTDYCSRGTGDTRTRCERP
jgi:Ca2+-binding RTX toxin-like protein